MKAYLFTGDIGEFIIVAGDHTPVAELQASAAEFFKQLGGNPKLQAFNGPIYSRTAAISKDLIEDRDRV